MARWRIFGTYIWLRYSPPSMIPEDPSPCSLTCTYTLDMRRQVLYELEKNGAGKTNMNNQLRGHIVI